MSAAPPPITAMDAPIAPIAPAPPPTVVTTAAVSAARLEAPLASPPTAMAMPKELVPPPKPPGRSPSTPPEPATPGLIERLLEGNIIAKAGIVVLFFGVGFLLKLAYDHGFFPPPLRLFGVAAAAGVMIFIGMRLLATMRNYALVLFGGAMGFLYLDVFFALKTFALIGAPFGFVLFALLGVATIVFAVKLDARAFAVLGLLGAFMAPILAATGSGNHVLLFSYYLLLNLLILAASWFKSWRELNLVGFIFTFAIALIWGVNTYQRENFATVEPFLIAFFLLYLAIPILFAVRQPPQLKGIVDGTLIFGMPLSAAMLQAALTRGMGDDVLAWSAFAVALIYAGFAWSLWKRENMRLLAEAHLALAVVFATVTPFFAFRGYPTFAFWTLEGAAIFWMGCRQKSVLARAFALCLQLGAAGYFWVVTQGISYPDPWWNDRVVGAALIGSTSLLTAWFMFRFADSISAVEASLDAWFVAWGSAWLYFGLTLGVVKQWPMGSGRLSALLFAALALVLLFEWLGRRLLWRTIRHVAVAHVPLIGVIAAAWATLGQDAHPFADSGALAWPLTFMGYFFVLHRQRIDGLTADTGWRYWSAWLLMLLLATWEVIWRYDQAEYWSVLVIGGAGLTAAALRFRLREYAPAGDSAAPSQLSSIPLAWALCCWFAGAHGLIDSHSQHLNHLALHLAVMALSVLLFEVAGRMLVWPLLRRTQGLLTLAMLVAAAYSALDGSHPFAAGQFAAWLLGMVVALYVLARQERDNTALVPSLQLVVLFDLAVVLVAWDLRWQADHAALSLAWQYASVGITLALALAVAGAGIVRARWPFATHRDMFRDFSVAPLLVVGAIWLLFANAASDGSMRPLPYLPILNPLDLASLALFAPAIWIMREVFAGRDEDDAVQVSAVLAALGFYWLNCVLLRAVHHWANVPYDFAALLHSVVAQAALSLLWTSTALVMMVVAGKRQMPSRRLWVAGAGLLGLVIAKLVLNDLGNTGTVARIVSFIGVGVLLLVIGYVTPLPPKAAAPVATEE